MLLIKERKNLLLNSKIAVLEFQYLDVMLCNPWEIEVIHQTRNSEIEYVDIYISSPAGC